MKRVPLGEISLQSDLNPFAHKISSTSKPEPSIENTSNNLNVDTKKGYIDQSGANSNPFARQISNASDIEECSISRTGFPFSAQVKKQTTAATPTLSN